MSQQGTWPTMGSFLVRKGMPRPPRQRQVYFEEWIPGPYRIWGPGGEMISPGSGSRQFGDPWNEEWINVHIDDNGRIFKVFRG